MSWVVVYKDLKPTECWGPFDLSTNAIDWAKNHAPDWHVIRMTEPHPIPVEGDLATYFVDLADTKAT